MRKISFYVSCRLRLPVSATASLLSVLVFGADLPPQWWSDRGVLTTNAANDYAALNVGQLKQLAYMAWLEMETLPDGAGFDPDFTNGLNNYAAVTVGQLKETARPFFDRLGFEGLYPWCFNKGYNDYALVNIGQAKLLFSFDPYAFDFDGDGMSDSWEMAYGLNPFDARDSTEDADHDRLTNKKEYDCSTNPKNEDTDDDGVLDGEDEDPNTPGPAIIINTPLDGETLTNSLVFVSGSIGSSASELGTVWVNGVETMLYEAENEASAFTNMLVFTEEQEGRRKVSVTVMKPGSVFPLSRKRITVTMDAYPPVVKILSPSNMQSFAGASAHVTAWTDSSNDVVEVNGVQTARDGLVRYGWVRLPSLGTNSIQVTAVDGRNRMGTNSIPVFCSDDTYVMPDDEDNDGVVNGEDPNPNNPSVRSTIVITDPPNGSIIHAN